MSESLSLNHLALPARQPEELREWYIQNLELVPSGRQLRGHGCSLTILAGTPLPNDDWHFGFQLSSLHSLENWKVKLASRGLTPLREYRHENYQSFFIRDPEGNDLEFFVEL